MIKRIYFDIETTYIEGWFWNTGQQYIGPDNIKKPAKIICIAWKWEGDKKVQALTWDKDQNEKEMLEKFVEVLNSADEVVAHNGKQFDVKWLLWQCAKHRIKTYPSYKVIDTLSMMRSKFRSPSNRLNYLAKELFGKEKSDTGGINLWHEVVAGNKKALKTMVSYCKNDVTLLEELFLLIQDYFPPNTNMSILEGKAKWCCAHCASDNVVLSKTRVSAMGTIRRQMWCKDCNSYYTVADSTYQKYLER